MNITIHLHSKPNLRIRGILLPCTLYVIMAQWQLDLYLSEAKARSQIKAEINLHHATWIR
jgi:hypothetical protein